MLTVQVEGSEDLLGSFHWIKLFAIPLISSSGYIAIFSVWKIGQNKGLIDWFRVSIWNTNRDTLPNLLNCLNWQFWTWRDYTHYTACISVQWGGKVQLINRLSPSPLFTASLICHPSPLPVVDKGHQQCSSKHKLCPRRSHPRSPRCWQSLSQAFVAFSSSADSSAAVLPPLVSSFSPSTSWPPEKAVCLGSFQTETLFFSSYMSSRAFFISLSRCFSNCKALESQT